MDWQSIEVREAGDGVWLLSLARPAVKNALSSAMRREISQALATLRDDRAVRAVVVTGVGDAFCAGFDIKEFNQPDLRKCQ
jgi:enoyl-CoA hydratase/carnithine racemase